MTTPSSEFTSKEAFPLDKIKDDILSEHSIALSGEEKKEDVITEVKDEDEHEYPKFFPLLLITIALCLAVFCVSLGKSKRQS